jgi:hypothetical protein
MVMGKHDSGRGYVFMRVIQSKDFFASWWLGMRLMWKGFWMCLTGKTTETVFVANERFDKL